MYHDSNRKLSKAIIILFLFCPVAIESFHTFSFGKLSQLYQNEKCIRATENDFNVSQYEAYMKMRKARENAKKSKENSDKVSNVSNSEDVPGRFSSEVPEMSFKEFSDRILEEEDSDEASKKDSSKVSRKIPEKASNQVKEAVSNEIKEDIIEEIAKTDSPKDPTKFDEEITAEKPTDDPSLKEVEAILQSSDEDLTESVQAEINKMKQRSSKMTSFTTTLKKSITKKAEFESFISQELANLSNLLKNEVETEREREIALNQLLLMFDKGIKDKTNKISQEKDLFAQMVGIQSQVKEESIRKQIDSAIKKKKDLISIEEVLKEDILECRVNLAQELSSTVTRAERIEAILSVLPDPNDISRTRAYDWDDLQNLQNLLMDNVSSLNKSNKRVEELIVEFENAVQQKQSVLDDKPFTPKKGANKLAVTKNENLSIEELTEIAGVSGIVAVESFGKTLNIGAQSVNDYLKGNKIKTGQESFKDLVQSTANYVKSIKISMDTALKAYDQAKMKENEITSFDKMFQRTILGFTAIKESEEVSKALNQSNDLKNQVSDSALKLKEVAAESIQEITANKALGEALSETLLSVQRSLSALTKIGSKYVLSSSRPGRLLKPSSDSETGKNEKKENN
mmetsp:Transcript_11374/g.16916  ORF Transcript_11374/g.16916 Transcript_11374/m.16916 type:complete len:627 (+) Transcript_11374:37-1917(+)